MSTGADIDAMPSRPRNVRGVMAWVLLAAVPGVAVLCVATGWGVVLRLAFAISLALLLESISLRMRGRLLKPVLVDLSAPLTAVLLTLMLPTSTSFLALSVGVTVALVPGKHLFGGLGENVFNPAMLGCATVTLLHTFGVLSLPAAAALAPATENWLTVAFALGGVAVMARRITPLYTPISMLFAFLLVTMTMTNTVPLVPWQLAAAAFFIVTDPVSGCATTRGRLLFGCLTGAATAVAGGIAALPFVVLVMNSLAPWLDAALARTRARPADAR